ncbi:MAG: hypothetical protein AAF805_00890 [Planctomycetota bacterium]
MLREKTQRRLCRTLFIAGCVAPTLAVGALVAGRLSGAERDRVLTAAGEWVGFAIRCDSFATPRPGVFDLGGVRLSASDPEPGGSATETVATCDRLRVVRLGDRWRFAAGEVTLCSPAIASGRSVESQASIVGAVKRLSIADAAWDNVSFVRSPDRIDASTDGRRLFGWSGGVTTIDTAGQPLPLAWLAPAPLAEVDANATFAGHATVRGDGGEAEGVLHGANVGFRGVTADRGRIGDLRCRWRDDAFTEISGRVELRDGHVAPSLVYGVNEWLGMPATDVLKAAYSSAVESAATGETIPFTQVAFEGRLDTDGLTIVGRCDEIDGVARGGAIAHAVAEHRGEPLLLEPPVRPLPAPRLLRALWPDEPVERDMPANRQAIEVARRLPMGETIVR